MADPYKGAVKLVKIYVCDIESSSSENIQSLMSALSKEQKDKVTRYRFEQDRHRCIIGLALTGMVFGMSPYELKTSFGEHEKPFIENGGGIHYNLSHSGRYVVIASGDSSLGIDIEKTGRIKGNIAKRFFSPREYLEYVKYSAWDKDYFCRMWTLKESYIKYDGRGLFLPLNSFSILQGGSGFYMVDSPLKFRQFDIPGGYIMSVCSHEEIDCRWEPVSVDSLCELFAENCTKTA